MDTNVDPDKTTTLIRRIGSFMLSRNTKTITSETKTKNRRIFIFQIALAISAFAILVLGAFVSWQTIKANRLATSAVSQLTKANKDKPTATDTATTDSVASDIVPSTTPPTAREFDQYVVAPDLARYIKISKISVNARVTQVGVDSKGAVGVPRNTNDASWYIGSAKPGDSGATLIDGHVSSLDYKGVFHDLKKLVAGDNIQIILGNGSVLNYSVVTSRYYNDNNVDMVAALSPITSGKSGLNLITCAGKIKPGTASYSQRLVVFAILM